MITNISNSVLKYENLFCVYRNFTKFKLWARVVTGIRILIESLISVAFLIRYYDYYEQENVNSNISFILCHISAILIIFLPLIRSRELMNAIQYLDANAEVFRNDVYFIENLKKRATQIKIVMAANILAKLFIFIFAVSTESLKEAILSEAYMIYVQFYMMIVEVRFTLGYLQFSWLLMMVSVQLDYLMHDISSRYLGQKPRVDEEKCIRRCNIEINDVNKWSFAYIRIIECTKLLNLVFGIQLTIMLAISVLWHVSIVYSIIVLSVENENLNRYLLYILTCAQLASFVLMMGVCAQSAQNKADFLRRHLNKLIITYKLDNDSSYKALRNLVRLVATRTLRAQSFGSFDLNMSLLPACVAIFMSYTVIALQFNNVV